MKAHLESQGKQVWKVVVEGPFVPRTVVNGVASIKPKASWDEDDEKKVLHDKKTLTNDELNLKVLISLTREWKPKVMTISKKKSLSSMTSSTLFGKIQEYETELGRLETHENQEKKSKGIVLKADSKEVEKENNLVEEENFMLLVKRIYEEDHNAHYKLVKDRRGKQNRSTPYDAPVGKGKAEVANGKKTSGGGSPASVVCFKYGEPGHKSDVCTAGEKRCFRCGKTGHVTTDCKHKEVICFKCGEEGHISSKCQKPKREPGNGKVFALAGTQTAKEDRNAGGAYFISNTFNYYH
ncbi:uncharacterized protein LOC131632651 [Vicia villosa]|uniref:uncharacterized protein LOC131632651 n=1 Tax=Vicia villosa TaxID=3911 RepID=UPI00273C3C29|nr:uncharacterized protein LOC131632651 [Vicia villosa]